MTLVEQLEAAKERISDPRLWLKFDTCAMTEHGPAFCAMASLVKSSGYFYGLTVDEYFRQFISRTTGFRWVSEWNDMPQRTHAEVMAAFDACIAEAKKEHPDV